MSPTAQFWIVIAVLALGTWTMRSLPIMLHGRIPEQPWVGRLLRYVPVAALTALVVPGALYVSVDGVPAFAPARTIAALVALLIALRTRSVLATLAAGMLTLWIAQALLG